MSNNLQNEKKKRGLAPAFLKYIKTKEYKNTSVNDIIKQINDRLNEYEKQTKINNLQNEKVVSKNNLSDGKVSKSVKNSNDLDVFSGENSQSDKSEKIGSLSKNLTASSKSNSLESVNSVAGTLNNSANCESKKQKVESCNQNVAKVNLEDLSANSKNKTAKATLNSKSENESFLNSEDDEDNQIFSVKSVGVGRTNLKSSAGTQNNNNNNYSSSVIKTRTEKEDDEKIEEGEVVNLSSMSKDRLIVPNNSGKVSENYSEENGVTGDAVLKGNETTGGSETPETQGMAELIDKLNEINNKKFESDVIFVDAKPTLGLQKKEEIKIDEDELRESISNALSKENETKKASKQKLTSEEIEKVLNQMQSLTQSAEGNTQNVSEIYDEERESFSMDALKRGLARSSIALLKISEIDNGKANKLNQIAENLSQELLEKEQTIQNLQTSLSDSFEKLDLELVEDIENELSKQIEELRKQQEEILEFNNNVNKLEAEYQLKLPDKLKEAEEYNKQAKQEQLKSTFKKSNELYLACVDYFGKLDRKTAINEFLQTQELQTVLGSAYYDVYNYILTHCKN